jgi:hypothetical protein
MRKYLFFYLNLKIITKRFILRLQNYSELK